MGFVAMLGNFMLLVVKTFWESCSQIGVGGRFSRRLGYRLCSRRPWLKATCNLLTILTDALIVMHEKFCGQLKQLNDNNVSRKVKLDWVASMWHLILTAIICNMKIWNNSWNALDPWRIKIHIYVLLAQHAWSEYIMWRPCPTVCISYFRSDSTDGDARTMKS